MRPCLIICCGLAVIGPSELCTPAHSFGGSQDKEKTTPKSAWLIMVDGQVKNDGGGTASRVEIVDPVYKYIGDLKPGASFKAPPTKFRIRYGHYDPWLGMESKELTFTPDYGLMELFEKRKQRVQSIDAEYRYPLLFIRVDCDASPMVEIMTQEPEAVQQIGPEDRTAARMEASFKPRSFKIEGLNIKIGRETVFRIVPDFPAEKEQVDVPIKITVGEGPTQEVHVVTYVFSKRGNEIGFGRVGNHTFEPRRLGESKILSMLHGGSEGEERMIQIQPVWLVIGICAVAMLVGLAGFLITRTAPNPVRTPGADEIETSEMVDAPPAGSAPSVAPPTAVPVAPTGPMEMAPPVVPPVVTTAQPGQTEPTRTGPQLSEEQALILGEKIRAAAKRILALFEKHPKEAVKHKNIIDQAKHFSELPDDAWLLANEKGVPNVQAGRPLLMNVSNVMKTLGVRMSADPSRRKPRTRKT